MNDVMDKPVIDVAEVETLFMKQLIAQLRAQDSFGNWAKKSDDDILADFIIDEAKKKEIPIIGDPDPDILWRIELMYQAVGIVVERVAGVMASPIMAMHPEGFGRMLLTAGRLVVINKYLRDVHRFGFPDKEALATAGAKLVLEAKATIDQFPDVAKA